MGRIVTLSSGRRVQITVASGKPIHPTPDEEAKRAEEFRQLGIEAPRLRLNPDRFMDSEHNRGILSPLMDGKPHAQEVRRALIAEQMKKAARFKGGKADRTNKKTDAVRAHVRKLLDQNPGKSSTWLYEHRADKKIIGSMKGKTFGDHVRALREK